MRSVSCRGIDALLDFLLLLEERWELIEAVSEFDRRLPMFHHKVTAEVDGFDVLLVLWVFVELCSLI